MSIVRRTQLINDEYLKEYSLFPVNYDLRDIRNFIPLAEELHVAPIIGQALFDELIEQIEEDNISEENSTLLLEIYKVEGIAVLYESLPFVRSHVSQVGITLGKSENSDSISKEDLKVLQQHLLSQLNTLKDGLIKFLNENKEDYPLYEVPKPNTINKNYNLYTFKKRPIDIL
jgi:hypothetical protein